MRKKLLNGEVICMSNEEYQTSMGGDDIRTAELLYMKTPRDNIIIRVL